MCHPLFQNDLSVSRLQKVKQDASNNASVVLKSSILFEAQTCCEEESTC